jgi:hypothetical protein
MAIGRISTAAARKRICVEQGFVIGDRGTIKGLASDPFNRRICRDARSRR